MALLNPHAKYAYQPREVFLPLHNRQTRWACVTAHRRCGKTVALLNDLIIGALEEQLPHPRFAFIAPTYTQAQRIAWDYLKRYAEPYLERRPNETDLSVQLVGDRRISLVGSDNPDSLRGQYLDGAVLDEFAFSRPHAWSQIILPALSDRRGWGIVSSTPNGQNEFYDVHNLSLQHPDWTNVFLPVSHTRLIPEAELIMLRSMMTEEEYLQEYECSFTAAVRGSIFGKQIEAAEQSGRLTSLVYHGGPVDVSFDLGWSDATTLWFSQTHMDGYSMFRYHENSRQTIDYYIEYIRMTGYEIRDLWLPHDAKQVTAQTGRSVADQFKRAGFNVKIAPKLSIADSIAAARKIFPSVRFDATGCADGLACLRAYHYEYDELKKTLRQNPDHDWASHGADGFRTFAHWAQPGVAPKEEKPAVKTWADMCLAELFEDNEMRSMGRGRI